MNYVYIAGPLFDDHERNYLESIAEIFETRGYKTFLPHRDAGVVSGEYTQVEKKKISPALFVRQVRQELQKVTWPERRDTIISSAIVILLVVLFSIFFLLSDQLWSFLIKKIIQIGSGF